VTHGHQRKISPRDHAPADRTHDVNGPSLGGLLMVEGTPIELKHRVALQHDPSPTLESVFKTWTGRSLDDDVEDEENP
jgi:hypothetical protein